MYIATNRPVRIWHTEYALRTCASRVHNPDFAHPPGGTALPNAPATDRPLGSTPGIKSELGREGPVFFPGVGGTTAKGWNDTSYAFGGASCGLMPR
jgi:hypothetical protein